jgi:hypothetical protein
MLADDGLAAVDPAMARNAGFTVPVALTRAVFEDCAAWDDSDNARKGTMQDEAARLRDVLWTAAQAARRNRGKARVEFTVWRTPRPGRARKPRQVTLVLHIGPGDQGEPVITVMQPGED